MKLMNKRELKRLVEAAAKDQGSYSSGALAVCQDLTEALEQKHLKPDNFSIRDLAECLIEDGREWLDWIDHRKKGGGATLLEAGGAVDTSAFANITGQIVYNRVKDAYEDPAFLWPELCETVPTTFLDGEKIPGIGRLGDKAEIVDEGQPFPSIGLNEEWVQTAATRKRGFMVPVTREIIVADRTMLLLKRADEGGFWMGLNKEKRVLDVTLGVTNNYNRNGVSSNTFLTSGAYINDQTSNAMDSSGNEWRALEKAELLFDAITDPNTGEPIIVSPDTIIVPTALKHTANRILTATGVEHVDMRGNAVTIRTQSPSPYAGRVFKILSSPQVKARTGSATKWFFGAPKKAVAYMSVWEIETLQAPSNSEAEFTQDIMQRFRVSERGVAQMLEPRNLCRNDQ